MAEEVPKENHILLALDLAGVEIEYIDNIGKIWRATNNVAQANGWLLEVKIYRDQCPETKQRPIDKVSDTDIRQAIASMVSSPGGNCDVLQDLADNDPPPVIQQENYKKFILIYVSDETNDDHAKILEKYDAAYGIGLRYATGQLVEIDNEYKKTFQADSMQDELNQLVFWAVEANIKEILKEASENFCINNPCDEGKQCVNQKDGYRCDDPCSQFTLCQGGKCHYNLDIAENQERRQCHCFGGFQGDYCDTDIDECALNICRNEAICINHIGYYDCICKEGFSGKNCDERLEYVIPQTIKVHANLVSGLIPESALKSIEGIYERFVDLKAVDNSHGLSYRPVYKNGHTGAIFSFAAFKTIKINDKDVKIKKWKIGQFFQYMFPLIDYDYDPDNPFTIGNFKSPVETGFVLNFGDLNDNIIKLEISTFQSCTVKGEKSCKNGGKCTKGKCSCPDGFKGDLCEEQFYRTETKIQKALKIQVDPDHHNLTGLYYQAMHNCHADFLGKDLFDYHVDDDGDDCRVPKMDIYYHCRENFTIYRVGKTFTLAMVNKGQELETVLTSEKSAKLIEDTAGSWIFEKDSSVTQFTIERTGACATFSYCKNLECVCIYGYDKNPIDGLCHANTLQTVFIILFFMMGLLLYIADYVQWFIRETFLPPLVVDEDEIDDTMHYRIRNPNDLDRAPSSKRRAVY